MRVLLVFVLLVSVPVFAGSVRVKGHVTKAGTYVAAHARTSPDSRKANNWSSRGNANPYTGKKGSK